MHGIRSELLEKQARALCVHVEKGMITKDSSNKDYEDIMTEVLGRYAAGGVSAVAFGGYLC